MDTLELCRRLYRYEPNIYDKIIDQVRYKPKTRKELGLSVRLWCKDREKSLNTIGCPIGLWDVSLITDMNHMFSPYWNFETDIWSYYNCIKLMLFNEDISDWDVSSVKDMRFMFSYASSFNQPLDSWDVSSVVNMSYMFSYTISFNQSLENWDTGSVEHKVNLPVYKNKV